MADEAGARDRQPAREGGSQRLMVSGFIRPQRHGGQPLEITRGMTVLDVDGGEAGNVAAVVIDDHSQEVAYVLLGRWHLTPEYRLVPVSLIEQVGDEIVVLKVESQAVQSLPLREPE